jgi:hypothetical protein
MPPGQYVVLGMARPQTRWFGDVAHWANSAALPVDFLMVLSLEELRALLRSGRVFSALLVDAAVPGCDRDVFDLAAAAGCAVIVVDDPALGRPWVELGAQAVLAPNPTRSDLLAVLDAFARPVVRADEAEPRSVTATPTPRPPGQRAPLVAITGTGGTGCSTMAMIVAGGLSTSADAPGPVLLADCSLRAQQGLLHDAGDVVPGLSELVEAHRSDDLPPDLVRELCFQVSGQSYELLLGLRRHRDWAALRPRAVAAALDGLRYAYGMVVADVDSDVEGEAECGSPDVQDRNTLARTVLAAADLVLVVGSPGIGGLHAVVGVLRDLHEMDVDESRLVPLVNRAPRGPRARAEVTKALAGLLTARAPGIGLACTPLFVPERKRMDDQLRDVAGPPVTLAASLAGAVLALLARVAPRPAPSGGEQPVAVVPGSLGSWALSPGSAT